MKNLRTIMSEGAQRAGAEQRRVAERLDRRIRGLASLSDEQLIARAPARTPVAFPWHEMEMQRRLKDSIEALTKEAARSRVWAAWGVAVIGLLTMALIGLTVALLVRG